MKRQLLLLYFALASASGIFAKPIFSFFNEMKGPELKVLFADSTLIPTLQTLGAEIRMGMLDLSPERADVLHRLNQSGIPVVAWLLLPEEQGYWFHSGNGEVAIERYKAIKQWADAEGIQFKGIGIDLELDMNDFELAQSDPWALIGQLPGRLYDKKPIEEGRRVYQQLLELIKQDGYPVESYYASFVKDETNIGSTSIQQLTKFLDVKVEKEIPMLYTSFMGNAYGLLKIYALDLNLQYVALGSTGGGVDTTLTTLTWEQLAHDIRVVAPTVKEIHIFSLEGCIWKGYLPRLIDFDFSVTVVPNEKEVKAAKSMQKMFIRASKVLSHPTLLFGSVILVVLLIGFMLYWVVRFVIRRVVNA
jgi:hypothetical protein